MIKIEDKTWSITNRIWSRFVFLYLVFYIFPYGFEYIRELNPDDITIWENITIWFGECFFGWEFDENRLRKGFDSKYDYSRFALITILAVFGALIWMMIDSKIKSNYNFKLKTFTRTILRYHVGLTLIVYGLAKVFMLQFGEMDLDKLESKLGSANAMGFLWNFMSYSKFYTMSTGWIEFLGGAFLLFRRTTFIGAIILSISMVNVVLIDIGYDVRVKMFAIHLLIMSFLLLSNDLKRLASFFVFNKASEPSIDLALFSNKSFKSIGYILKGILLTYFTISSFFSLKERIEAQKVNRFATMTRFHDIDVQVINEDTVPKTNGDRWKSLSINGNSYRPETLKLTYMNNRYNYYSFTADTIKKTINFDAINDTVSYSFHYVELPNKAFIFEGSSNNGDSIWIKTQSKSLNDYRLTANKIKWVTDLK